MTTASFTRSDTKGSATRGGKLVAKKAFVIYTALLKQILKIFAISSVSVSFRTVLQLYCSKSLNKSKYEV